MSRSISSLSKIPVSVVAIKADTRLHWQRRAVQIATLVLALLIPVSGLFRIDPVAGAFTILDRQVWWADFFLVFGFWIMLAALMVTVYSFAGTAFCGWSCPQNTLSEWANQLTHKLLGRRAEVINLSTSGKMQVAAAKNKWTHWLLLGAILFIMSAVVALIPLFYFYPPSAVWAFVTFSSDARLASSLHFIYFIFVLVILLDVAFIRHYWCRFMCVYKVWQHGFKTQQTLHIAYDATRSADCEGCNYCVTSCFIDLDPRKTDMYDTCINCGECITACNKMHAKSGTSGLLKFAIGARSGSGKLRAVLRTAVGSLSQRMQMTVPIALLGVGMFVWGLWSYQGYHLAVYQSNTNHGAQINDYRVAVSNKVYRPAHLAISIDGLPAESYSLATSDARFNGTGRVDINLHIAAGLAPGIHTFLVRVRADDGWADSYRVQHFVARG